MYFWNKISQLFSVQRIGLIRDLNYPGALIFVAIVLAGIIVDKQNQKLAIQELRGEVRDQIGLVRTKLESNIRGNIHLVQGLISTLQTEPEMKQARYSELAQHMFDGRSQLRNIAAAPDLVISLMYPIKGNEKAIGLNYRKNINQRAAVMRVMNSGQMVLAGPINLVQGGQGIIGRFPVFTSKNKTKIFWGIVSAVIDVDKLYVDSGLVETNLPVEFALVGKDAEGNLTEQFFGNQAVMTSAPETSEVKFPNGSWQIAAIPKGGWNATAGDIWYGRILIILTGAIVFIPVAIAGRFAAHRKEKVLELKKREEQLKRLSTRLELALDASKVGVFEMNYDTGALVWDDRMNILYNMPVDDEERSYQEWEDAIHPDDLEQSRRIFRCALDTKSQYNSEFRIIWNTGEIRNIRSIGAVYEDKDGSSRVIGVNWDVTADVALTDELNRAKQQMEDRNAELLRANSKIEYLALHDALTGIPNRRYLDEYLADLAEIAEYGDTHTALLIIDLDRFKQINDTFGHLAGDAMLVHVSQILKKCIRDNDFVARIGGDEFVIVCNYDDEPTLLDELAVTIIEQMSQPFIHNGSECRFGASIGISFCGSSKTDIQQLLVNADLALYRAKNNGRNRYEFFTRELHLNSMRTKKIADDIQRGIELNEFIPFYQPQFDATTHAIVGVEALARWDHPSHGILTPDKFLEIAEDINVTTAIDQAILGRTLVDFDRWSKLGLLIPKASVNVSLQRLHDKKLLKSLRNLQIQPGTLSFELVESIFLDDCDDVVIHNIDQIKQMGIDIEIDDFGTGHTSIVSLLKLKPKRLKVDRQLVIPATSSEASKQLLSSIIDIGRSLHIEVVAEGVETVEHAHLLRHLGCDILQGYALARPMSSDALEEALLADIRQFA